MRCVAIADIHGRSTIPQKVTHIINAADFLIIAGDITNFGGYDDTHNIVSMFTAINKHIVAIPGNCDRIAVNKYLVDKGISLHMKTRIIGNIALYGVGGCSSTPFHTPQEYSESDIGTMLKDWERNQRAKWHVLVTHSPPANTKLDRTLMGAHVGSKVIRTFIENFQPDLVVCGHIHEAKGADRISNAVCINPGPFPEHYAIISLNGSIEYELH
jgi:Icc-related predicted phosphoesterase